MQVQCSLVQVLLQAPIYVETSAQNSPTLQQKRADTFKYLRSDKIM